VAASQIPTPASGGVLGSLSNNVVAGSSFSGGSATASNLAYSEAGSFLLNTSAVVGNFLASGLALDAVAFNASGAQQARVGRFIPAGFAVSGFNVNHRSAVACPTGSTFSYLGEDLGIRFTLTAQNTTGATTQNYSGSFAKLVASAPANHNLAGISGTTMFKAAQYTATNGTGTWNAGLVNAGFTLNVLRATTPVGPFDNAQFGIAPVDSDGVGMLALNLDTDSPANVADSALLGQIPLRYGRLRLQNGMSAANRPLTLPIAAQYWNGAAYTTNLLDACTKVIAANLSFGNFRKSLTAADAVMNPNSVTVNPAQPAFITLSAPGGGRLGSMDVAIALDIGANPADQSCLKTSPPAWAPTTAATTGANLKALRGAWCGATATSDPSARAVWGLYRGSDGVVYQRENY
jgi:MSHA biogenesis protein MshQ